MFGGDGRFHTRSKGDFTPPSNASSRGLLNVVFTEYSKSWKPVHDINFEYIRSEMNSQFANIATPSEIVVSTTFTLEFGGNDGRHAHLLPVFDAGTDPRPALQHHAKRPAVVDKRWIGTLRKQLQGRGRNRANWAPGNGRWQILKMKVGDVIP